ncbi:MAG: transporter [Chlorobiaceae bacterium]|nr:transporter [Chlorobiaceae bacterium]
MKQKALLTVVAMLWATPLHAAHPLITDDTGTQGKGRFQLELNSEFSSETEKENGIKMQERSGESAATLSYGLSDNIDVVTGLPWQWFCLKEDGSIVTDGNGIGDLSFEIKWRFYENKDQGLSLAIKPGISLPTGNEKKGFGNGRISEGIMMIATREWQHGAFHCNVGYTHNSYSQEQDNASLKKDLWHASVATEVKMMEKLRSVFDVGIDRNTDKAMDANPVYLLGGLIYSVTDNFDLDIGVKKGMNHAERDKTVLAGLTARF